MTKIQEFITTYSNSNFVYGSFDCAYFVKAWLAKNGKELCLDYDDARSAALFKHRFGSLQQAAISLLGELGLPEIEEPQLGAIGLIPYRHNQHLLAVYSGSMWVAPHQKGVQFFKVRASKIWSVS